MLTSEVKPGDAYDDGSCHNVGILIMVEVASSFVEYATRHSYIVYSDWLYRTGGEVEERWRREAGEKLEREADDDDVQAVSLEITKVVP